MNDTGEVYLSHTQLAGRYAIHLAVGNGATGEAHVSRAWELLQEAAG